VATVSRVINRIPSVDEKLAKKVWAAVKELGYFPNAQARALVSGRSSLIGVIISDITNPFFPELIQSFEDLAIKADYEILVGSTAYDLERMEVVIQRMLQRNVDGVAVMTFGIEAPLIKRLAAEGIPLVFMDVAPPEQGMSAIVVDYATGIHEAVQHLAVLGHRRIAFIAGPDSLLSASLRKRAFLSALATIGLAETPEYMFAGDHTLEGGIRGMEAFLHLHNIPTAIVCSNDMTAIGVLHAIARARLRVPEDISIIGFDDIHMARYTVPPLTTVQMSCRTIADMAFNALRAYVEGDAAQWRPLYPLKTHLNVRQSTGIPSGTLQDLRSSSKHKSVNRLSKKSR
jgi:DNA-binding LacI/PurR family transcriptional regulator